MFTGLVEDTGAITATSPRGNGVVLTIQTAISLAEVEIGASIAVDGCCLTVESMMGDCFTATAGLETMDKTTVGGFAPGRRVHLERALRVGDRLGGHLVQGHVDGVGRCVSLTPQAESTVLWFEVPEDLSRYVAAKGSICIDGVSLTVNQIDGDRFRVNIVPHTLEATHMGALCAGAPVNLEVDILAKYVERMLGASAPGGLTIDRLRDAGF
jgi:riboflavin synthase